MKSKNTKKIIQIVVSLAVTIVCLVIAFRQISFEELLQTSHEINWWMVVVVSIMAVVAIGFRAWRWSLILKPLTSLQFTSVFNYTMIGFMVNNILPAHAGELIRAYLMGRKTRTGFFAVTSTILIERLFDAVAIILFLVTVLLFIDGPPWLHYGSITASVGTITMLFFLGALTTRNSKLRGFVLAMVEHIPARFRVKVRAKIEAFIYGLNILKNWRTILPVFLLSLFIWLFMGATVYVVLVSFPIGNYVDVNMELLSMTTVVLLALAVVIPSSPGYIGVTQLVFITTFGLFVNLDAIDSVVKGYILNGSVVFNLTQYIPITILGIILLFKEGLTLKSLSMEKEKYSAPPPVPGKVDVLPEQR